MKQGLILLFFLSTTLFALPSEGNVSIAARAFTKADCKRYLKRDVIRKGYQPVQIYIENDTDISYLFSTSRVTLPTVPPEEVSKQLHTSSASRIARHGGATLLASPLFAVPVVVDGFKSSEANEILDRNFLAKAARDCVIPPHSHANMILFVPRESFQKTFSITLIDEKTNKPIKIVASTH